MRLKLNIELQMCSHLEYAIQRMQTRLADAVLCVSSNRSVEGAIRGLMVCRLGHLSGRAFKRAAAEFQLPLSLNLPGGGIATPLVPDRKQGGRPRISSAALIYAEELRVALTP